MKLKLSMLALAGLLVSATASADTFTMNGDLSASDPFFNRPYTLTSLSIVGTNVHYDVLSFTVNTTGAYSLGLHSADFDAFEALYTPSFDPANGLTNLVALNDDDVQGSYGDSLLAFNLTAGTVYHLVATSYDNDAVGSYTTTITGPGGVSVAAVPEPASMTLALAGLGLVAWGARRRTSKG